MSQQTSRKAAATDLAIGFGEPLQDIVDINFQSGPDPSVDSRVHFYNAARNLRLAVPVRSTIVLLRPKANWPRLHGLVTYTCGGKRVLFEYDVVRLWEVPVELFLKGGPGLVRWLPLLECRLAEPVSKRLREVIHEIDRRPGREIAHAKAVRLMTATFTLTGMRIPKEHLASIFEGVRIMHKTTAWDAAIDVGIVLCQLAVLRHLGKKRLGEPGPKTQAELSAIQDVDRILRMIDEVPTAKFGRRFSW